MAEKNTLARPYAKAVFEIAKAEGDYEKWSTLLRTLTEVASDDRVLKLLSDFTIPAQELADLFIGICDKILTESGKNLIKILSMNRRLGILPEITLFYETLRREAEQTLQVECISAVPLSDPQKKNFAHILTERLQRSVKMACHVDPKLIGGFVVRAGDVVVDGSIKGQLIRLKEAMGG